MERSIIEKVYCQSITYYDSSHCILRKKYYYSNKYYENKKSIIKSKSIFAAFGAPYPMDATGLGTQNFRISKKDNSSFCRIPKPDDSKVLRNSRILQDFEWLSWNSCQNSQSLQEIHGFPVRLTEHLLQDFQCRP